MNTAQKEHLQSRSYNGYQWAGFESGLHYFQKQDRGRWLTLCCEEKQIFDGDMHYMSAHNYTLDRRRQSEVKKKYLSNHLPLFQ